MVEGRVNNSPAKPRGRPRKEHPWVRAYQACPYSPSCFECPMKDCAAKLARVVYLNTLPEDIARNAKRRNERRFRLHS